MIDIKKVSQNFFSQKKNIIIIILIVVLIAGIFFYFKYKKSAAPLTPEEQVHEMVNDAADQASKLNLTEDQRSLDLENSIKNNPGKVLPPKEAKNREAEIIRSMYQ